MTARHLPRRRTRPRPTASSSGATCGCRYATFDTACRPNGTPSSAATRLCSKWPGGSAPGRAWYRCSASAAPARRGWRRASDGLGSATFPAASGSATCRRRAALTAWSHAVAQGLDVPLGKDDPVTQLGHAIAGRGACLVILDNFEQVARHAAGHAGPLARPRRGRTLPGHDPRSAGPAWRRGARAGAAAAGRGRRSVPAARRSGQGRFPAERRGPGGDRAAGRSCWTACRSPSSWPRRACG